jgi:hypothetical protein
MGDPARRRRIPVRGRHRLCRGRVVLLEIGPTPARVAAVPLLVFSAPFIIMRNTLRGRRLEQRGAEFVMLATVIAGLWSLMSGTVVVMALQALLNA